MLASIGLCQPPIITAMGIPRHGEAQPVDDYLLPDHWCFHIYSYEATLELDLVPHRIRPGSASLIPPGTRMVYRYLGPSEHVYFHFQVCGDCKLVQAEMVQDLAARFTAFNSRARLAVERASADRSLATALLWSMLWEYIMMHAKLDTTSPSSENPVVTKAVRHIEQRLASPLSVESLSHEVGVTSGYLTRLFSRELGMPVSEYVRQRRADQAAYLLESTTLPVKVISRMVGIKRATQFNRLMHETKGAGPRKLREQSKSSAKDRGLTST